MKARFFMFTVMVSLLGSGLSYAFVDIGQSDPRRELKTYAGYPLCSDVIEKLNDGGPEVISESYILNQLSDGSPSCKRVEGYVYGDTPVLKLRIRVPLSVKGNTEINRDVVDDPDLEISKWLPNWPWSPVYIGNEKIEGLYNVEEVKAKEIKSHRYILSTLDFLLPKMKDRKDTYLFGECWINVEGVDIKKVSGAQGEGCRLNSLHFYTHKSIFDSAPIISEPGLRMYAVMGDRPKGLNEADWGWLTYKDLTSYRNTGDVFAFLYSGNDTEYMKVWPGFGSFSAGKETKLYHFDLPTHVYYVGSREDLKALVASEYFEEVKIHWIGGLM